MFTAEQLTQIPACARVHVTTVTGEVVSGLYDGAFGIDATGEICGCQVATAIMTVKYLEKAEIAKIEVFA